MKHFQWFGDSSRYDGNIATKPLRSKDFDCCVSEVLFLKSPPLVIFKLVLHSGTPETSVTSVRASNVIGDLI